MWVTCSSCSNCPHSSGLGVSSFVLIFYLGLATEKCVGLILSLFSNSFQIDLHFFDAPGSFTAGSVTCSDPICSSVFQTTAAQCSENNQCGYSFRYGDGSGTSGYYMTDTFYFDAILGESLVANSSAPIVFG